VDRIAIGDPPPPFRVLKIFDLPAQAIQPDPVGGEATPSGPIRQRRRRRGDGNARKPPWERDQVRLDPDRSGQEPGDHADPDPACAAVGTLALREAWPRILRDGQPVSLGDEGLT
jgi:hypothetical protein